MLLTGRIFQGSNEGQGRFAFHQVIADIFTQRFRIRGVIENVINNLERIAEMASKGFQRLTEFILARQNGSTFCRQFEQARSLAMNNI